MNATELINSLLIWTNTFHVSAIWKSILVKCINVALANTKHNHKAYRPTGHTDKPIGNCNIVRYAL